MNHALPGGVDGREERRERETNLWGNLVRHAHVVKGSRVGIDVPVSLIPRLMSVHVRWSLRLKGGACCNHRSTREGCFSLGKENV